MVRLRSRYAHHERSKSKGEHDCEMRCSGNIAVRIVKAFAFRGRIGEEMTQSVVRLRLSVSADERQVQLSCGQHCDETLASGCLLHGDIVRRVESKHLTRAARTAALDVPLRFARIQLELVFEHASRPDRRRLNVLGNADPIPGKLARSIDPGIRAAHETGMEERSPRKHGDRGDVGTLGSCDQVGAEGHLADVELPARQLPPHRPR